MDTLTGGVGGTRPPAGPPCPPLPGGTQGGLVPLARTPWQLRLSAALKGNFSLDAKSSPRAVHAAAADFNQGCSPLIIPSPRPLRHSIPTPLRGFGLRPHPPHEAADLWDSGTEGTICCSVWFLVRALRGCKHPRSPALVFCGFAAWPPAWACGLRLFLGVGTVIDFFGF